MNSPSPCSDPNSYSHPSPLNRPDRMSRSHDGVILASTKPKKRAGRTKFKETRHPVYRGVRMRRSNKWVCEVREPNKKTRIWLGTYPTAEMAARAHDVAALALRGNLACLNFADSVWRLPVPITNNPTDIRNAAAEAAEAFRLKDMEVDGGDGRRDVSDDKGSDGTLSESEGMAMAEEVEDGGDGRRDVSDDKGSDGTLSESEGMAMAEEVEVESYMDEEAVFYMHRLISDMAEGMLIPPPPCLRGWSSDDVESPDADMCLWNFSI
ncbi:dehydration-responsive element-binding protein 1D [Lactuca sativa]|uniref:dehydration-responsive element-binding protein 1D n=1 Tax=Lactuca sativa TaxID=4236 RepID=UPI0022AF4DFD|nr:dehydration-responsive element-binding protein 1D [Lactuca sativa]